MRTITLLATSAIVATLLAAALATSAFAQGATWNKRTFLTFSGPVQMPGVTLPAGTYVLRIANPASPSILTVLDAKERHVLGQFFYVPTRDRTIQEVNKADGKPVVTFHEAAKGMAPAIRVFYYPTDLAGNEFLYPKAQAEQIAAASHHAILATASNAAEGGVPRIITVEPAPAQPAVTSPDTSAESRPVATSGDDSPQAVGTTGQEETATTPAP
jgi:hypothetical protein